MNSNEAIQRVCNLPATSRAEDRSDYDLVRNSGVAHRSLTAESVILVLQANPKLVDDWLFWSEDQRCTPVYYFMEDDGKYVVGRHPGDERQEFDDRFAACADFIVKAINQIW